MAGRILILIDDSDVPFWAADEQVWTDFVGSDRWLRVLRVNGFRAADALKRTVACVREADLTGDHEFFVVTDSRFEHNPQGGADLLEMLRAGDPPRIAWKRGVIYSEEPERGRLDLPRDELRLVHRRNQPKIEGSYIAIFLETGEYPDLADIRHLRDALTPLLYCCDSLFAAGRGAAEATPSLRPMKEYGVPRDGTEKTVHVFDPVLMTSTNLPEPYAPSTVDGFTDLIKRTFSDYFTLGDLDANSGAKGERKPPDPEGAWRIVLRNLHPWESLEPGAVPGEPPAVRSLWEIIRIGGDPLLLSGHPASRAEALTAHERVWVRKQLDAMVTVGYAAAQSSLLPTLVKRVVREIQSLDQVMRLVADGEYIASERQS